MFPYFRSASQLVPSSFASAKRRPIRKQERRNRLSVLQLEDRVTPSTIAFNLLSPTVQATNSAAIGLGTLTDTFVTGGALAGSSISINWGDGHTDTTATVTAMERTCITYSHTVISYAA